jgi:hypothetical protein
MEKVIRIDSGGRAHVSVHTDEFRKVVMFVGVQVIDFELVAEYLKMKVDFIVVSHIRQN